jgi:hypothetical protein
MKDEYTLIRDVFEKNLGSWYSSNDKCIWKHSKFQGVYLFLILEDKIIYHADNLKFRVIEIPKKTTCRAT